MFKREDLKSGMVLQVSSNVKYLVVNDTLVSKFDVIMVNRYDDDLRCNVNSNYDIEVIWDVVSGIDMLVDMKTTSDIIWKRVDVKWGDLPMVRGIRNKKVIVKVIEDIDKRKFKGVLMSTDYEGDSIGTIYVLCKKDYFSI